MRPYVLNTSHFDFNTFYRDNEANLSNNSAFSCTYENGLVAFRTGLDGKTVANCLILALDELASHTLNSKSAQLKIAVLAPGQPPVFLQVKSPAELESHGFWQQSLGFAYAHLIERNCETLISDCICAQYALGIRQDNRYHYTGKIPCQWRYVWNSREVIDPQPADVPASPQEQAAYRMVWEQMCHILPNSYSTVMLMHSLLSFYMSSLRELRLERPENILYLHGETGSGKTGMAKLFFGFPYCDAAHISFAASGASIARELENYRDRPFILDDARPPINQRDANAQLEKFDLLGRNVGDLGSGRGIVYRGQVVIPICDALPVITGEQIIPAARSALSRTVFIPLQKQDVNFSRLARASDHLGKTVDGIEYYNRFLKSFITRYVCSEQAVRDLHARYARYVGQCTTKHGRWSSSWAYYLAMYDIFAEYGNHLGIDDPAAHRTRFAAELKKLIKRQETLHGGGDSKEQIYSIINEMLEGDVIALVDTAPTLGGHLVNRKHSNIAGYVDGVRIHLRTQVIADSIIAYLYKYYPGQRLNLSAKRLRQMLAEDGMIDLSVHSIPGIYTRKKQFNGERRPVTTVYRSVFEKHFGHTDSLEEEVSWDAT